jgi:hypothetical protein
MGIIICHEHEHANSNVNMSAGSGEENLNAITWPTELIHDYKYQMLSQKTVGISLWACLI